MLYYANNETFSYIISPRYERDVREIYPSFVSRSLLSSLELGSVVREAEPVKTEREHDNQKTGKGLCRILKHVRVWRWSKVATIDSFYGKVNQDGQRLQHSG